MLVLILKAAEEEDNDNNDDDGDDDVGGSDNKAELFTGTWAERANSPPSSSSSRKLCRVFDI